jgi:hypothetical protein
MADENSRYNVQIALTITDATTGEPTPFSRTIQEYSDMKYEVMQETQMVGIAALLTALGQLGNRDAEEVKAKRGQGQAKQAEKFER